MKSSADARVEVEGTSTQSFDNVKTYFDDSDDMKARVLEKLQEKMELEMMKEEFKQNQFKLEEQRYTITLEQYVIFLMGVNVHNPPIPTYVTDRRNWELTDPDKKSTDVQLIVNTAAENICDSYGIGKHLVVDKTLKPSSMQFANPTSLANLAEFPLSHIEKEVQVIQKLIVERKAQDEEEGVSKHIEASQRIKNLEAVLEEFVKLKLYDKHFGRPHSRVPDALLLYSEKDSWFTGKIYFFSVLIFHDMKCMQASRQ